MSQKKKGKFLTEKQREYLSGAHDPPTENAENKMRSDIRNRVAGVLEDVFWVNDLSNEDLKLIFKGANEITTKGTSIQTSKENRDILPGHEAGIDSLIALSCRGYMEHGIEPGEFTSSRVENGIEKAVADSKGYQPGRVSVDIETSVTVHDEFDSLDALEKWDRNLRLTQEDMQELHSRLSEQPEVDKVAGEDLNDLIERHLIDSDE